MLHLIKLCVGVRDIAHLRELQAARTTTDPPLRHRTRNHPRRAAEIIDGGSMYWVVCGAVAVRQRVLDIIEDRRDDGTPCAGIVLDAALVPVAGRLMKPFQGWRYLPAADAPEDLADAGMANGANLPAKLRRDLQALGLI